MYPVLFRWSKACKTASITGSFNNWGPHVPLQVQSDVFGRGSLFSLIKELPAGIHCYKFQIDGEWKYDPEVAFTMDAFGNINNIIEVLPYEEDAARVQTPTKSILRNESEATMNPDATVAVQRVRDQDVEYGLEVNASSGNHRGSLSRSKSDHSLQKTEILIAELEYSVKRRGSLIKTNTQAVLLAAKTEHFGGDLVTYEHSRRQQSGGHRSILSEGKNTTKGVKDTSSGLIIFLVGLPGRGKTFIGHILCRHMTWMGHNSKLFTVGEYRRQLVGTEISHKFWDPLNKESYSKRGEIASKCLDDALLELESEECTCVIFDATNSTVERRALLRQKVLERGQFQVVFVESIINDPMIIESMVREMKLNSQDYQQKTLGQTRDDYNQRIKHYASIYETLSELENFSFIKIIDAGRQLFCNAINGYLQSRIIFVLSNFHFNPRPIWLSRHGQSMYNISERIGGDSGLSPLGTKYAQHLDRFIEAHYPIDSDENLEVWTSTMQRTGATVQRIMERGRRVIKWKQLDEIDAGICDGLTYAEVAEQMPEEYLARKTNKLHYRYPRGESYQDVIHRLEPVITELMRQTTPVLIVAHQAILRVLYGYLMSKCPEDCPMLDMPLHKVIQLTPKAYKCEEVWHSPM